MRIIWFGIAETQSSFTKENISGTVYLYYQKNPKLPNTTAAKD